MNTTDITSRTGDAEIKRQGHTTDGADGNTPDATIIGRSREVRELKP